MIGPLRDRRPWVVGEKPVPPVAIEVQAPFRKLCPTCKTIAFVPVTILEDKAVSDVLPSR